MQVFTVSPGARYRAVLMTNAQPLKFYFRVRGIELEWIEREKSVHAWNMKDHFR